MGNNCVITKYLWAGIVVWEVRIKNVLSAFGSIQLRYKQLQALMGDKSKRKHNSLQYYHFILVLFCIIIVQRKILFKINLMHSCSCNTQVLSGYYRTD